VNTILENIFKGFVQWICGLCLEIVQYISNSLLDVFSMDLTYFRQVAPITDDILQIMIAAGWALLLGNLVFQAMKSMATGLGFEGEDPKLLFTRTFVFAFLLLASQQICEIGLNMTSSIIQLLQIPSSVTVTIPEESNFNIGASWLLVSIVSFVIMWQFVKFFFEIAERYVVTAVLVLLSPLAFAMGGSKNTEDIFRGWCRMFGSMCTMMVLNVVFLKLLISAMGYTVSGVAVLPWMLLIVGIARVARKVDSIIAKIGLNPAITGDGLGRGFPGMVAYSVVRGITSSIAKTAVQSTGKSVHRGSAGGRGNTGPSTPPPSPPPSSGGSSSSGAAADPAHGAGNTATSSAPGGESSRQAGGASAPKPHTDPQTQTAQESAPTTGQRPVDGGESGPRPGKASAIYHTTRRTSVPPESRSSYKDSSRPAWAAGQRYETRQGTEDPYRTGITATGQSDAGTGAAAPVKTGPTRQQVVRRITHQPIDRGYGTDTVSPVAEGPSAPIRQEGTPKIQAPPGVSTAGRRETSVTETAGIQSSASRHGRFTTRETTPSGTAGTETASRPTRPPIGGRTSPAGMAGTPYHQEDHSSRTKAAPTSDTAGIATARQSAAAVPPQQSPISGTAGKAVHTESSHLSTVEVSSVSDMAGTRRSALKDHPSTERRSPSGMAGKQQPSIGAVPLSGGSGASTGTAGTRRPPAASISYEQPVVSPSGTAGRYPSGAASTPSSGSGSSPAGMAGTASSVPQRPGINQGTKRLNKDPSQVRAPGKSGKKNSSRRRGGASHE
jgi:hypothetical protein